MKIRSISTWLAIAIFVACIVRIVACFQHNPCDYLFSDPKRHWLNGERLFHPDLMGAGDPILYQIYIFSLRAVTADNRFALALACAGLSVLMPWLFYRASRELGFDKKPALWVWALIAWTPSLFVIYHYFMMETLLLPLVGVSLWMTARCIRKGTTASLLLASGLWTLSCLTKPTVAPLAGLCLVWAWWKGPRRIVDAVAAAALGFILLIPSAIRAESRLGFYAPLGNPWLTKIQHRSGAKTILIHFGKRAWLFSSPSCYIQPLLPISYWAMSRAWGDSKISVSINPAKGILDWQSAYQQLHVGPGQWLAQLGENIVLFLFSPSWPDSNGHEWDGWLNYISRWIWAPIVFFIFDCNIRVFLLRRFDLLPVVVTAFTLFLAFQNLVTTEGRYRKPLEPLLLMNVVWAVTSPRPRSYLS